MKILILCTGNSCRSQMAHGFLQSFDQSLEVYSAGTYASGQINPKAVLVMKEAGIDISHHTSDPVDMYLDQEWDYVITVCGGANETCPAFTGKVKHRLHMGFDDPSQAEGTPEFVMSEFYRVRDEIKSAFFNFYEQELKHQLPSGRAAKALQYFDNSFNCAQSVLASFAGELGLSEDDSLRVACAFGGGMGRQQYTCGAVTGAAMALGLKFGKALHDAEEKKKLTYEKTVRLFEEFEKLHGSSTCRHLLENLDMRDEKEHAIIVERNLFNTSCRTYVADAVKIAEKIINDSK